MYMCVYASLYALQNTIIHYISPIFSQYKRWNLSKVNQAVNNKVELKVQIKSCSQRCRAGLVGRACDF